MDISKDKKIYFASDNHLGAPSNKESRIREKKFVKWLDSIKEDAEIIFLLGDLFDFWFEYKHSVPKGFTRTLGKLAELSDQGIKIYFFVGNHDMWMNGYFENELNIEVFYKSQDFRINDKNFMIGHGDGLGPGDKGFKRMKKMFRNSISKFFFRWIHPDIGVSMAQYFSMKNKLLSGVDDIEYKGEDNEWLVKYAKRKLTQDNYDFFVFGHRHLPLNIKLSNESSYINTGDWISYYSYAEFDGNKLELKYYKQASE